MNNTIIEFSKQLENTFTSQLSQLNELCRNRELELQQKEESLEKLKKELDNKQNDIDGYNKVSFIKKMDNQLNQSKKQIQVLELRINSYKRKVSEHKTQLSKQNNIITNVNECLETLELPTIKTNCVKIVFYKTIEYVYTVCRYKIRK